jgi:5-methylcytosine-specific restriction enzyme subunit McrC
LEYAYSLQSLRFLDGLFETSSLAEFYERLALILAQQVLAIGRKGLYRAYLDHSEWLPALRGRLQVPPMLRQPWQTHLFCDYQEHTADVEENQILGWALHCILRSGLCTEVSLPTVRRAYKTLQNLVTLQPYTAEACRARLASQRKWRRYSHLNQEYHPLHALCSFFLDESGPGHTLGEQTMLPFIVDMERLFERFVAGWLHQHIGECAGEQAGEPFRVQRQERYNIGSHSGLHFTIDLVVYTAAGSVRWVGDTKYKAPSTTPDSRDILQVVAYAQAKGAPEAVLIYPASLERPIDVNVNGIRVRSLAFSLADDLETAGRRLVENLVLS